MKLKINWLDWLSKLCIVIGVSIFVIVMIRKDMVDKRQSILIEQYREMTNEKRFNQVLPDTLKIMEEDGSNVIKVEEEKPIGILSIPQIDLETAVLEGVNQDTLRFAVGHYEDTPLPSEGGNFCIVGHRSYSYGAFFNRLDEVESGDTIYMEVEGETFCYLVQEIFVVEPEDTWVLNNSEETMITLITCTPIRIGTKRLIIKAILIK